MPRPGQHARALGLLSMGALLLLLVSAGFVTAQGPSLQAIIDETPEWALARLGHHTFPGGVAVDRPLFIHGEPGRTILEGAPNGTAAIHVQADDVTVRFLGFVDVAEAVRVAPGMRAMLGPFDIDEPSVAIHLGANATAVYRPEAGRSDFPGTWTMAPGTTAYLGAPASIRMVDEASGADVRKMRGDLFDGATLIARYGIVPFGVLDMDVPVAIRAASGDVNEVDRARFSIEVSGDGYLPKRVPLSEFGNDTEAAGGHHVVRLTRDPTATPSELSGQPTHGGPASRAQAAPDLLAQAARVVGSPAAGIAAAAAGVAAGSIVGAVAAVRGIQNPRSWPLGLAALYSRIAKHQLLDHETRERIHACIEANPGIHYRGLLRQLQLPNGVLAHHVRFLLRAGLVSERREGQTVRFFAPGATVGSPQETGERLAHLVDRRPGLSGAELARELRLAPSVVHYHLNRLEARGRVLRRKEGKRVEAYPAGAGGQKDAAQAAGRDI